MQIFGVRGVVKKTPYTSDEGGEDFQTPGAYPGSVGGFALISDVQTNNAWFTAGLSHLHSASEQESTLLGLKTQLKAIHYSSPGRDGR